MRKIVHTLSISVILIALLDLFAWSVLHVHKGGKFFGVLTPIIVAFAEFPSTVASVINDQIKPQRMIQVDEEFEEINNLKYDIFALTSTFKQGQWNTELINLRNDSSIFKWVLDKKDYRSGDKIYSHAEPRLPIILSDTSLILHNDETFNLFRLNSNSEIIWKNNDFQFHHSINPDHNNDIWACTREIVTSPDNHLEYWDNYITKLDVETGKTLFHKSLTEIFIDNNLSYLVHGLSNEIFSGGGDPFHLNEIEPVTKSGGFLKRGDLLLSLRHRSMVIQYRPLTKKIIRTIQGDFYHQHDVDILSDSVISVFDNNVSSFSDYAAEQSENYKFLEYLPNEDINQTSGVRLYNLSDSSFSSLYPNQFITNEIYTRVQGLHHLLSNGDLFVEEWVEGKIFIFNGSEILLRRYANRPENGLVEYPHWIRLYENLDFLN